MNSFERELSESAKIPVQPPDRLDGISKFLIALGVILWGGGIYSIVYIIKFWLS